MNISFDATNSILLRRIGSYYIIARPWGARLAADGSATLEVTDVRIGEGDYALLDTIREMLNRTVEQDVAATIIGAPPSTDEPTDGAPF